MMHAIRSTIGPSWRMPAAVMLLTALIWFLFFHRLADRDLWGSHEARAAQDAGSMLHYHDWTLPRLTDEQTDLQKPPMYYWLVAATAWVRGTLDEMSVRLPAAISAALTALTLALVLLQRGRRIAAIVAAIVLITSQHFTWLARTARIDMPLTLCLTIAVLNIGLHRRWQIVGFLAIAVAILLKGPIGLVLPLAVIVADRILERVLNGERLGWLSLVWGIPFVTALTLPWFIEANDLTHGEFFRVFFWHHNFERAMGGSNELAVHPWWFYGPRLLVDALPWTIPLVPAVFLFLRYGIWRIDREARLGLLWLLVVVAVLSCAKFKRADYILPAHPGLAMLLGCLIERAWLQTRPALQRAVGVGIAMIVVATIGAWGYWIHVDIPNHEPAREQRTFARAIREVAPAPATVLFFRVECHPLAFHLGRPINSLLEWENLDIWAGRPGPTYIVMSPNDVRNWRQYVTAGALEEVFRNTDFSGGKHERPLVLMRTRPRDFANHGASREQTSDSQGPDQHGPAGAKSSRAGGAGGAGLGDRTGQARPPIRNPASG